MALSPGTKIGHYDVTALLGEGGMGQVWQATDTQLNRQVALKILPDAFASDPDRLARFKREAQILASLNHPNIAAIYGIEESEGTRALVLELVEGPTLADRISKGPIPLDEALPIAKQIAEALEAAHEAGVIHRDLKPANIKVREDGTVKVLDFGLAKAFQPDAGDLSVSASPTISLTAAATQMGMVIGTAAYMAPEQAKGLTVDKRADIWAYGAVLFEMLTGKKLFDAGDVSEMLASVLVKDPDISSIGHHVPAHIRSVVRQCLVKDPKERLRDIGDVRLAMKGAFEPKVSAPTEPTVAPRLRLWQRPTVAAVMAAVLIAVGIAGGLAVWSLARPAPQAVTRFEVPLRAGESFTGTGRHIVAASPDGRHIVYATTDGLSLRSLDQVAPVLVAGTDESAREPFFSADGQWIGFYAGGQLRKVATSGGAPVTLGEANNPWGVSWGTDDMILYGQGSDGIWRVPGTSGTPEVVITMEDGEFAHGPQVLPGDEWVLFTLRPAGVSVWDAAQIVMQSLVTGERVVLIEGGRDARYVKTGHLVYALNVVLFAVAFDRDARQVLGGPVPLVEGVRDTNVTGAVHFSVARNGSLVYVRGLAGGGTVVSLVWVGRDGDEERIPVPPRAYDRPRVSPDGTRVAVDIVDGDNTDVWIWDLARETLTQLTFDEGVDDFPLWTPDSARVVFRSSREGGGLFWKAADGTGQVERLKEGAARPNAWAADGRLIFEQARDIGVLTMEGERTVEMLLDAEFREAAPALSPDGRWLAYLSNETGTPLIYVQPFPNIDDGLWNVSLGFGADPVWSPDGRELFYRSRPDLMVAQIETEPTFSSRTPEPLFSISSYGMVGGPGIGRRFDLAPDGDRFIVRTPGTAEQTSDDDPFNGLIFVENWFEELKRLVPVP